MPYTEADALEWKRQYEQNPEATIESVALDNGVSTKTISRWFRKVNTQMRPASGGKPTYKNIAVDGVRGKPEHMKKSTLTPARYRGHRSRSKYR